MMTSNCYEMVTLHFLISYEIMPVLRQMLAIHDRASSSEMLAPITILNGKRKTKISVSEYPSLTVEASAVIECQRSRGSAR
jgi:hypothetical protein